MKKELIELNAKVKMISAASEALSQGRKQDYLDSEKVMRHISSFVASEKNEEVKMNMIASASKAISILEKEPSLKDKEIIKKVMLELPSIYSSISDQLTK